ncbi:DUF4279 domain-containing protein [Metabacillus fastidiosus]|uniref:DUF4279 domain-containing protein n=1 Tax=Metabacillus fastidiosus TaxID=1458 RepID=UPI002E21181D|nr:DUF4279 domain-containing protein [Metabacillus fastidiosus]
MAYFSITGNVFPLSEVTKILNIEPTTTYKKGDIIVNNNPNIVSIKTRKRIETLWELSTDYQKSYDINDQLNPLLDMLEAKVKELNELKEKYDLFYMFMIVIQVENNQTPATCLENRIINFASSINAQIHFDMYVFS